MPLLKHAVKKARQDKKKTARNRIVKEQLRDTIKAVETAALRKTGAEELKKILSSAYKKIDKAAKKFLIHKNKAANQKSRLARLIKTISGK
jgi:small subunit ribosomal protein S20